MRNTHRRSAMPAALGLLAAAVLAACSNGGDPQAPAPQATLLKGVAATGAPMAGASISVIDSDSTSVDPAAVTAGADGTYSVDVSQLKAPLIVRATATVDGAVTQTVAVVPSLVANTDNTANVTPLTHAVAALVAPGGDPAALLAPATLAANGTAARVANASALLVNTLATDSQIAGALGSGFNPLSTPFVANGSGADAVLDQLGIEVSAAGVTITNLAAPLGADGLPAPVTLSAEQATTPTTVPTVSYTHLDVYKRQG